MTVFYFKISVSHDPSEIIIICWFGTQEIFNIIINVNIFFHASIMNKKVQKNSIDLEYIHFLKIINIFTVTFDQCNISLLQTSININFI